VVPWLWFLSLSRDCRIFQEMDVLEIVEEVFTDLGYSDFDIRCMRSYPKREYCVQYRESHLSFVSRLMDEEGIFYFFEHSESTHTLVIADDNSSAEPCPAAERVRILEESPPGEDVVHALRAKHSVHLGRVTLRDYDYLKPSLQLESSVSGEEWEESYDYPGLYDDLEEGDRFTRIRLEESEVGRHMVQGTGRCRGFRAGFRFDLEGHYRSDANRTYMLVEVRHEGQAGGYRSGEGGATSYSNHFLAIPHEVPFRPARQSEKPVVRGTQTAVVVGPSGEEIWVDEHSRIKVQFHWDRRGQKDENSSCWIRVASTWAGKSWGAIEIPRIGQEVLVDFLEGDPDRPIVVGSVYNAEQTPPWGLPGSGTISGVKSRSSKGGGGYNEISLEDKKGSELLNIHAQKNMVTKVLNNQSTTVDNDQSVTVHNDQTITVDNNRKITVTGERSETVTKNTSLTVTDGDYLQTVVKGSATIRVKKDVTEVFEENQRTTVTKEIVITAGDKIKLVTGDSSIELSKDGTIKIVGKSVVVEGKDDATMEAPKATVSGGDEAKLGVGSQQVTCNKMKVNVSGAAINSSAVGMHEIAGALVKIN
jgi:type VI secretion system secreted protein VgrG